MDILRSVASTVSDTVNAILDGATVVLNHLNSRKRARPSSTASGSPLSGSTLADELASPALFSDLPAPLVTENDFQPQAKRRRISFPPEEPIGPPPSPPALSARPSPIAPAHLTPNMSDVPFAVRRSSSGLQDALEAPTPPPLAFTSRSRIAHTDRRPSTNIPNVRDPLAYHGSGVLRSSVLRPPSAFGPSPWSAAEHRPVRPYTSRGRSASKPYSRPVRGFYAGIPPRPPRPAAISAYPARRRFVSTDPQEARTTPSGSAPNGPTSAVLLQSSQVARSNSGYRIATSLNQTMQAASLFKGPNSSLPSDKKSVPASFADLATRGLQIGSLEEQSETDIYSEDRRRKDEQFAQRMCRSKMRSSELRLELFVRTQQKLQDNKRREDAERILRGESEPWRYEIVDEVEEPPSNASYWDEVYWRDVEGNARTWNEGADAQAVAERNSKVTVSSDVGKNGYSSAYAPLTRVAMKRLRHTFANDRNIRREFVNINGCVITGEDLRMLKPNCWLNDEVVNAYTALLSERNTQARESVGNGLTMANGLGPHDKPLSHSSTVPKIKIMNSFFYAKLVEYDRRQRKSVYNYQRVRRWTRRFDVFSFDMMLIPINQQNLHWTLGVVHFENKTVEHLDSMGTGGSPKVREHLLSWVFDEAADKGKKVDREEWKGIDRTVPVQENTDDCGVFLCKFADFLSRGWSKFTFSQEHMKYFRSRIAHELLMGKAT